MDVGAGLTRALELPNRTGAGRGGCVAVVGAADQANGTQDKRLSSRMEAGGWTAGKAAVWMVGGSQIMPMLDKGASVGS